MHFVKKIKSILVLNISDDEVSLATVTDKQELSSNCVVKLSFVVREVEAIVDPVSRAYFLV